MGLAGVWPNQVPAGGGDQTQGAVHNIWARGHSSQYWKHVYNGRERGVNLQHANWGSLGLYNFTPTHQDNVVTMWHSCVSCQAPIHPGCVTLVTTSLACDDCDERGLAPGVRRGRPRIPGMETVISKHSDHLFNVFTEALCRGQPGVRPVSGGCGDVNYDVVTRWKTGLFYRLFLYLNMEQGRTRNLSFSLLLDLRFIFSVITYRLIPFPLFPLTQLRMLLGLGL